MVPYILEEEGESVGLIQGVYYAYSHLEDPDLGWASLFNNPIF
jgi:hypothetical protein